jgi:hypothetical protein
VSVVKTWCIGQTEWEHYVLLHTQDPWGVHEYKPYTFSSVRQELEAGRGRGKNL